MRKLNAICALLTVALASCGNDERAVTSQQSGTPPQATTTQPAVAPAQEPNTAVEMHLVEEPGFGLVLQHCVTCHGPRQFLQQRGDRATWLGLIRWMQSDHGMQPLPEGVEDRIVDYLATHYGPEHAGRRKPLPAELMPPNRYQ